MVGNRIATKILSVDEIKLDTSVRFTASVIYPTSKVGEVTATCVFPLTQRWKATEGRATRVFEIRLNALPAGAKCILGEDVCMSLRQRLVNKMNEESRHLLDSVDPIA
jgi:hypothetical protein